jgi:hypothetical protein
MIRSIVVILSAIAASTLHGQPQDVVTLREEHEKSVAAATKMLDDSYRLTLHCLERERAENGDYEGALRVKDRLDALEKPAAAAAPVAPACYSLLGSEARTQGGGNYDRAKDFIEFRKAGGAANWELLRVEPGTYEAFIIYSVGVPVFDPTGRTPETGECGGTIALSEATNLTARPPPLQKTVTTTGSWENFVRASLGRHDFKSRSATLRVEALAALPGGLIRLRRIDFVPVSDGGSAGATGLADSLRELQKKNRDALAAALAPIREKLESEFDKLERECVGRGDTQGASAVVRARTQLIPKGEEPVDRR